MFDAMPTTLPSSEASHSFPFSESYIPHSSICDASEGEPRNRPPQTWSPREGALLYSYTANAQPYPLPFCSVSSANAIDSHLECFYGLSPRQGLATTSWRRAYWYQRCFPGHFLDKIFSYVFHNRYLTRFFFSSSYQYRNAMTNDVGGSGVT